MSARWPALLCGWLLALAALALPDPERWAPGARFALAALALGVGAAVPARGMSARLATLVALPPLLFATVLDVDVLADASARGALALALVAALGYAAGALCDGESADGDSSIAATLWALLGFLTLGVACAAPLLDFVLRAHGGGAPRELSELARWSPLRFLHGSASLDPWHEGVRAFGGAALIVLFAHGARHSGRGRLDGPALGGPL